MKKLHTILATTALAFAASNASAIVYNYDVSMSGLSIQFGLTVGTLSVLESDTNVGLAREMIPGIGWDPYVADTIISGSTASYDTGTGILTINDTWKNIAAGGVMYKREVFTLDIGSGTDTGSKLWSQCWGVAANGGCAFLGLPSASDGAVVIASIDVSDPANSITFSTSAWNPSFAIQSDEDWVLTASPIPVPAAAWLFGSALVGLVGIGRKRKTA